MLRCTWLPRAVLLLAVASLGLFAGQRPLTATAAPFEVWATEQSGTAGKLYIYDGAALDDDAAAAVPEVVDLGAAVAALCLERTGTAPVRAHMFVFNPDHTHGILSYVATGHVVFLDGATRAPLACLDVGLQAHAAFPSPDSRYVVVANQNGKLLQRITTDYATNTFTLDAEATLNLAACTTPSGARCQDDGVAQSGVRPDNAPICPVIDASSRLIFTTLRGGGMFVVDGTATPMRIIAEYDRDHVQPEGCGGVETKGRMYINSGNASPPASHLYSFALGDLAGAGPYVPNTPAPDVIFSQTGGNYNTHGLLLTGAQQGRYLWAADRFANAVEVVDTMTNARVGRFSLESKASADPAPDLMAIAPDGGYAFVALRGPCPLTANSPVTNNAVGVTPGVGVIAIQHGGSTGKLVAVAPITSPSAPFTCGTVGGSPTLTERADVHGIAVRRK